MKKISILALCLLVLLCFVSCAKSAENTSYEGIIDKYTELLSAKSKNEALTQPGDSANEIELALYEIVRDCEDPKVMGYATKDINKDGTEELVLLSKGNKLYALFTKVNDSPVLLLKSDQMSAAISPDGTIFGNDYIQDQGSFTLIQKISDGKLGGLEYGTVVNGEDATFYKIENSVKTEITRDELLKLDNSMQSILPGTRWNETTKKAGFRFVSALPDSSQSTAPVPDFSSYDGILSAYKTIVESFSEYQKSEWVNGKYDNLFNITDNESYDVFHQIFLGGISVKPASTALLYANDYPSDINNAYGYAKKDLNGDGTQELILLNDNYEIITVFTMKDGKAVHLEGLLDTWLDENGRIHKSVTTGGVVGRDREYFVYEIDGTGLKQIIGVGSGVNISLEKENWYKTDGQTKTEISDEEGEALYAEYDLTPKGWIEEEYTRFTGIEFVPLFDATLANEKHINTYSQMGIVSERSLTVSAISDDTVTASIEFVKSYGEWDPVTNPDPEVHYTNLEFESIRNGNRYEFEKDGIKGYIEFAVNSVWVVVTESKNEHVDCMAILFNRIEKR